MSFMKGLQAIEEDWTKVDLIAQELREADDLVDKERIKIAHNPADMELWCKHNCTDEYAIFAGKYYFKNPSEASWFSLVWT